MKKLLSLILSGVMLVALSGCSADYSDLPGYSEIMEARRLYTELYAAHLTVTDKVSDTLTQELTFYYDSEDRLCYSYFGTDGETDFYEYHNGSEYSFYNDGKWVDTTQGDENYRVYTRKNKMSMCTEGILFFKPESVTSSTTSIDSETKVNTVTMQYDASALNSSMKGQLGLVGNLESFEVVYILDKDGYCTSMEQIGKAKTDSGEEITVDYLLTIDKMNDVGEVTRPLAG